MNLRKIAGNALVLYAMSVGQVSAVEPVVSAEAQIGTVLHDAFKLNTSTEEYAHMSREAARSHGGMGLEEVLSQCVRIAFTKGQYTPEDVRAVRALAESMRANDQRLFEDQVKGGQVFVAMQVHASILDCAMPVVADPDSLRGKQ